jgi:tight adherence protein B
LTVAVLVAGLAGACAVAGAWDAFAALEQAHPARVARRLLAPVTRVARNGGQPTAPDRRRLAILGAATLLAAGWTVGGPAAGLLAAAAGPWAVGRLLAERRRRWRRDLVADAPTVARALSDALAGGHSIRGAIAEAARGMRCGSGSHSAIGLPAVAAELRACEAALALGEATDVTLDRLARRAAHPVYDTLVAAVLMQRDAGGDLAGLLRQLADTLRDAQRVEDDARVATAQARFTGWIVAGLPVAAAAVVELAAPGSVRSIVSTPPAATLGGAALAFELLALALMRRLGRVGRQ